MSCFRDQGVVPRHGEGGQDSWWSWELTSESFAGGDPSGALCFTGHGPHIPEPRSCDGIYRGSWRPLKKAMVVRGRKGQETLEAKGKFPEEGSAMVRWDRDKIQESWGPLGLPLHGHACRINWS